MRQFTIEVLPKFPARVDGGAGISVAKANGVYTFNTDYAKMNSVGSIPNPANTDVLVQLPDGSYARLPVLLIQNPAAVNVRDFGAVGDGVADDTDALLASIAKLGTEPGSIVLGRIHKISAPLVLSASNQHVIGLGSDTTHNVVGTNGLYAGSRLLWAGPAGGRMMQIVSPEGTDATALSGGGVQGVYFDGNNLAGYGLQILSRCKGTLRDLFFREFTTLALDMDVVTTLGDDRGNHQWDISQIGFRNVLSAGTAWKIGGDEIANTSLMRNIRDILVIHDDGDGIVFGSSDNIVIQGYWAFRFPGGTGAPYIFNGSNAATGDTARNNTLRDVSTTGAGICRGTPSYTYPSTLNRVEFLDVTNSSLPPTIETGATCVVSYQNRMVGLNLLDGVAAPAAIVGQAIIYIDTSDGDLKVKFGDGTIKTIVVDT